MKNELINEKKYFTEPFQMLSYHDVHATKGYIFFALFKTISILSRLIKIQIIMFFCQFSFDTHFTEYKPQQYKDG